MIKYWKDCSKEEHQTVNTIARCYRYFLGGFKRKQISREKFEQLKSRCLLALNLCEFYYSDKQSDIRDFQNWKQGYEMYQKVRREYDN